MNIRLCKMRIVFKRTHCFFLVPHSSRSSRKPSNYRRKLRGKLIFVDGRSEKIIKDWEGRWRSARKTFPKCYFHSETSISSHCRIKYDFMYTPSSEIAYVTQSIRFDVGLIKIFTLILKNLT